MTARPNIRLDSFEQPLRDDPPMPKRRVRYAVQWLKLLFWSAVGLFVFWLYAAVLAWTYARLWGGSL